MTPKYRIYVGLSVFLILFAAFALWLSSSIYNSQNFKNNAVATFKTQATRDAISGQIVDQILSDNPGLKQIISSPAQSAISGMLASPYLDPVIEKTALKFQSYLTSGQNEVTIDLAPVNNILTAISGATSGSTETPQIKNTNIVVLPANLFPNLNNLLRPITTLGPILGVIGLVILISIFIQDPDKIFRLRQFGLYLLIGCIVNLVLIPFAASLIPQYVTNANAAIITTQAFNIFSQSYLNILTVLTAISILMIASAYIWPRYYQNKLKEATNVTKKSGPKNGPADSEKS